MELKSPPQTASKFAGSIAANPLLPFALAAHLGILFADSFNASFPPLPQLLAVTLGLFLLAIMESFRKHGALLVALTAAVFAVLHAFNLDILARFPFSPLLERYSPVSVEAEGIVAGQPIALPGANRFRYPLKLTHIGNREQGWRTRHRVAVRQVGPAPEFGNRVRLQGDLHALLPPRNPGEFDFDSYLKRNGIVAELRVDDPSNVEILTGGGGSSLYSLAFRSREWIKATITRDLVDSPGIASVLQAMVLGDRQNTPDEIEDGFRHSGALHIFAVSGLHVGIFGTIVWTILKLFGIRRANSVLIIIPCLFFYAYVTGLSPSAVRAAIMASVFLWGFVILRPPRLLNSLSAAALLVLTFNTQQLFMPGFQLSFTVLAFIALLAGPIQKPLNRWVSPDPFIPSALVPPWRRRAGRFGNYFVQLASVSAAAWIGSAPLSLWHFHLITPIAILANCVLVPLAWLILVVASLSVLSTGIGFTTVSVLFNNANWVFAKVLVAASSSIASLPGSHFYVDSFPEWRRDTCRVTVLDTGLGGAAQSISIAGRRHHVLIDAGGPGSFHNAVLPFLRRESRSRLDALVITHGDAQHLGGAVSLLDHYRPATIIESPLKNRSPYYVDFLEALDDLRPPQPHRRVLAASDVILALPDKEINLRVLYPPSDLRHDYSADDQCVVLLLECHSWKIIFMSDSGFAAEKWLLEHVAATELRSDVIIKGRHRSDYTGLAEFLNAVKPEALISTNTSFPDTERIPQEWKDLLDHRNIALFDQSETGAVTIRCAAERLQIDSYLTRQTLVSKLRP